MQCVYSSGFEETQCRVCVWVVIVINLQDKAGKMVCKKEVNVYVLYDNCKPGLV